jgi:glucose-fructose oxidoreductase
MKRQGKVRYAVVGLGHIAQVAVLPAFRHARRNSELVALVSDDPEKLAALGRRYRAKLRCGYRDLDELYRSGEVDAVYIALPNSLHESHTVRAARAGIHVLCEKPMADSAAECERMIAAARESGVKLMIAYRLHFERATLEALALARPARPRRRGAAPRPGKLGDLRFFSSEFSMQVAASNETRLDRDLGGGPLQDIGIYCINAARAFFAAEPTEVSAAAATRGDAGRFSEVPATVAAVLRFPGDRLASFTCSFDAADRSVYSIVGTKGSLAMEPAYAYAEGLAYEVRIGERTRKRRFAKSDQFAPELLYFSDCVRRNREPEPSGQEGLADVRVIEALERSIATRAPVRLDEPAPPLRRPALDQEERRPPVAKARLVNVSAPH